ncbi:hypothetical protein L1887_05559 [Cichorium endivia]|nr:hypothetical protein L1887_05559 [Cichorium endivia]
MYLDDIAIVCILLSFLSADDIYCNICDGPSWSSYSLAHTSSYWNYSMSTTDSRPILRSSFLSILDGWKKLVSGKTASLLYSDLGEKMQKSLKKLLKSETLYFERSTIAQSLAPATMNSIWFSSETVKANG